MRLTGRICSLRLVILCMLAVVSDVVVFDFGQQLYHIPGVVMSDAFVTLSLFNFVTLA